MVCLNCALKLLCKSGGFGVQQHLTTNQPQNMYNIIIPGAMIHLAVMKQSLHKPHLVFHAVQAQQRLLHSSLEGVGLAQLRE